jgi:hypothetical protein
LSTGSAAPWMPRWPVETAVAKHLHHFAADLTAAVQLPMCAPCATFPT